MAYEVQVFYDPRIIDIAELRTLHEAYGEGPCESEAELRAPFFRDEVADLEIAVTHYSPLTKDQSLRLAGTVLGFEGVRVEISNR
jgi:hypothetical protein